MRMVYKINLEDYLEAQRTDRTFRQGKSAIFVISVGSVVIAILGVVLAVQHPSDIGPYVLVVVGIVLPLVMGPGFADQVRREYRADKNWDNEITVDIDDDGILSSNDVSSGKTLWQGIRRALEAKNLFTLYLSEKIFVIIPKRAFTPEQLVEFRELLARKILQKK